MKKAGDPAQCKAAAPAELTGVGPAEAVRRVQACLKALAAMPVPAKEVR
jgi:hypothetical protein